MEFLTWLSNISPITWVRESDSLLGYTLYLAFHTIGMVMLVGPTLLIAARVLGLAPALPLKPLKAFRPFMTIGLWITIITGTVLFATAPVGYVKNIVFIVKIAAIVLAVGCLRAVLRELFSRGADPDAQPVSARAKTLTAATVALWLIGVVAGRLTAYSGIVVVASIGAFAALMVVAIVIGVVARVIRIRPEPAFVPQVHAAPLKGGK